MPHEYTDLELRLLGEPEIIAIHYSPEFLIPQIDYTTWKPRSRGAIERQVQSIVELLNYPYIEDSFGSDHRKRISWDEEMAKKLKGFWDYRLTDALRGNYVNGLFASLANLRDRCTSLPWHTDLDARVNSVYGLADRGYNRWANQQKRDYVETIKHATYSVLTFLADQTRPK